MNTGSDPTGPFSQVDALSTWDAAGSRPSARVVSEKGKRGITWGTVPHRGLLGPSPCPLTTHFLCHPPPLPVPPGGPASYSTSQGGAVLRWGKGCTATALCTGQKVPLTLGPQPLRSLSGVTGLHCSLGLGRPDSPSPAQPSGVPLSLHRGLPGKIVLPTVCHTCPRN